MHFLRLPFLAVALLLLSGCATTTSHMSVIPDEARVTRPESGKALLIFFRPTNFAGAIQSTIYDGDTYIGTLSGETHMAYQASPGSHMFMIIGESADFMRAEVSAGKTYYAEVVPRMGVWKARFSLRPVNGSNDMELTMRTTKQVAVNDEGRQWAREHAGDIQAKKAEYLPKWESKPDGDKQTLRVTSGR